MALAEYREDRRIITYKTLRKSIGYLGILLPLILLIGTIVIGRCQNIQESISHYYYTIMGGVFVGTLCAVALFLIIYRGYNSLDNILSSIAGFSAIGIALFPTSSNKDTGCRVIDFGDLGAIEQLHYVSAIVFFVTLAIISIWLFRKSSGNPTTMKIVRNKVYFICGISIFGCLIGIFLLHQIKVVKWLIDDYKLVFFLEWIALLAFGISWLVKGEFVLLKDRT